jgi:hypothetical protein
MAALNQDPFDVSIIDTLNEILRRKCPYLSLFYEKTPSLRGKYSRKIGFYYNKTVGDVVYKDVQVSYIELDANLENEITIQYSSTVEEDEHKIKFKQRKLNVCLRLLAGMIAATEDVGLNSVAFSPITLYTMVKYFDCTIQKERGVNDDTAQCRTLADCKTFMEQAEEDDPENDDYLGQAVSISIKTSVPNYSDMLEKLTKVINTGLNCVGLGGTRKRKRHKVRNRRSRRWVGW